MATNKGPARLQPQVAQAAERRERGQAGVRQAGTVLQIERAQRGDARDCAAAGVAHSARILQRELREAGHAAPAGEALACARAMRREG